MNCFEGYQFFQFFDHAYELIVNASIARKHLVTS